MLRLVLITFSLAAVYGQYQQPYDPRHHQFLTTTPRPYNYHPPAPVHYVRIGERLDGEYKYGYDTGKGPLGQSFREEVRLPDGTVKGTYGYIDERGRRRTVSYTAGKDGFTATGDVGPEGSPQAVSPGPAPAPVQAAPAPYVPPRAQPVPKQYTPPAQQHYAPPPRPAHVAPVQVDRPARRRNTQHRPAPTTTTTPPPPPPAYQPYEDDYSYYVPPEPQAPAAAPLPQPHAAPLPPPQRAPAPETYRYSPPEEPQIQEFAEPEIDLSDFSYGQRITKTTQNKPSKISSTSSRSSAPAQQRRTSQRQSTRRRQQQSRTSPAPYVATPTPITSPTPPPQPPLGQTLDQVRAVGGQYPLDHPRRPTTQDQPPRTTYSNYEDFGLYPEEPPRRTTPQRQSEDNRRQVQTPQRRTGYDYQDEDVDYDRPIYIDISQLSYDIGVGYKK